MLPVRLTIMSEQEATEPAHDHGRQLLVTRTVLERAADEAGLTGDVGPLWAALERTSRPSRPASTERPGRRRAEAHEQRITLSGVAVYAGGTIALLAMSVFAGTGWATYGAGVGLAITAGYLVVFVAAAELLRRRHAAPAGVLAAVAVATVPLVVYAAQSSFGAFSQPTYLDYPDFYAWVDSVWVVMEVATVVAALGAYARHRVSFVLAPLMVASYFLALDAGEATGGGGADG